jgi:ligand-binding sensor domain-containing protein/signal transduction histidine kinase
MKRKATLLCFLLVLFVPTLLRSQHASIQFDHISIEEGLSQSVITCIYKDKEGFLWFGTQDGLNKYDGYEFTVYKSIPFDSTSLADNWIQTITEDENGHLWIGTYSGGIFELDKNRETFINYKNIPGNQNSLINNRVWALLVDKSGSIWIGTTGGLDKFDKKKKIFTHFTNLGRTNNDVNSFYEDSNGIIWMGTWGSGLISYNKEKNYFTRYHFGKEKKSGFNYIKAICADGDFLWLGTSFGLLKFNKKNKSFKHFPIDENKNLTIQNSILSIYKSSDGNLWIGTHNKGLYKVDINTGKFLEYKNNVEDKNSISDNWVSSILLDEENIMWIGTGMGINRVLPYSKYFMHYSNEPKNPNSLSANEVNAVFEDHQGTVWVGTWGGGLNSFNVNKKIFKHYSYSNSQKNNGTNDIIWSIFEDKQNILWIGTYTGLKVFDRKKGTFKEPPFNTSLITNNNISNIYEDGFGYLWIGTWGGGLYKYDKLKKKLTKYTTNNSNISDNLITTIYSDSKNNLWIGTNAGGLNRYNYKEDKFFNFSYNQKDINSLSNNNVTWIFEDKFKMLWIGTWGGGLNMFDLDKNNFKHFTETDGLSNNIIYGILPDENNNLWISTSSGLSRFNLIDHQFITYDEKDGLGNNQFSQGYFKCKNGVMIFGGIKGMTVFNPNNILINKNEPHTAITSFSVFNKELKLDYSDPNYSQIRLNYNERDFSIEFSALEFMRPDKNKYVYILEGYEKKWISSKNRRKVFYTNIQPGEYFFKVKASNGDNIWDKKAAILKIVIVPPFWRTWQFIIIVIIMILTAIYSLYRYRLEQLLKLERMRNTIAVDLHDDIGASLTRISLFCHAALRALKKFHINKNEEDEIIEVESLLTEIDDNSRDLVRSMSDIVWAVNPKNDSFEKITIWLKDYTTKVFEINEIDYEIDIDPELSTLSLPMDFRHNIFMIYKEGISNILKHAKATKVNIQLSKERDNMIISIKDNGIGFIVDNHNTGNGLKNINLRASSFKGYSTISSIPGKGTILNVTLKLP